MADNSQATELLKNIDCERNLYIISSDMGNVNYEKKDFRKALNNFKEAIEHFAPLYESISQNPDVPKELLAGMQEQEQEMRAKIISISSHLGDEAFKKKKLEEALSYYKNLVTYVDDNVFLLYRISHCLRELGAFTSSARFLEKVVRLEPDKAEHYRTLGDIYNYNLNNAEKAIGYYLKYIEIEPPNQIFPVIYNILGHLYEVIDKYGTSDTQIKYFEKAVELSPDFKSAIRNLCIVYPRVGRDLEAVNNYHKLFKLGATMDDYFDYAAIQIKLGNFEEGWKYYEYRFSKEHGATPYPKFKQPRWKGQEIQGKTLLVQCEQGFGDSIQFFRYLPQLKSFADKIIFRVQNGLRELLAINTELVEIVGSDTSIDDLKFDYHVPLMSLLHILDARKETIPLAEGYIKPDPEKVEKYKKEFFDNDCFKIGITWHGSALGNERRNVPLEAFYPLAKMKNIKLYSFQKDKGSEQLLDMPEGIEIVNMGEECHTFLDTASAMANVDLFLTSDNAVFNLAGAMGLKTFVLLSKDSEWRWFFDEKTMPWYKSVRIFKKKGETDPWDLIMGDVVKEIEKITS